MTTESRRDGVVCAFTDRDCPEWHTGLDRRAGSPLHQTLSIVYADCPGHLTGRMLRRVLGRDPARWSVDAVDLQEIVTLPDQKARARDGADVLLLYASNVPSRGSRDQCLDAIEPWVDAGVPILAVWAWPADQTSFWRDLEERGVPLLSAPLRVDALRVNIGSLTAAHRSGQPLGNVPLDDRLCL